MQTLGDERLTCGDHGGEEELSVVSLKNVYDSKCSLTRIWSMVESSSVGLSSCPPWGRARLQRDRRDAFEIRAVKSTSIITKRSFRERNSLRRPDQHVEVDLDQASIVVPSSPVGSTPCL